MSTMSGWIGVDLDGTLAHYADWAANCDHIGEPVPAMLARVRAWLAKGQEVKIFTARASASGKDLEEQVALIEAWCIKHIGQVLPITCVKDFGMIELWDDRAVSVEMNTGRELRQSA